ncbi:alkyl/aryl-sulfatase [Alkaliphilus hydrothermalis]|uniref:Alkyl sulfatase BDS1-like metallo-beta-lactamase superfamily hydrolase n=1 Tax=Alkaliphilus hydrothermalis TaxID=1482730 RepID=A0ABS2NSG9_9FIRM|nr:alkyl sulfatase dimerization domain-containing protein [Alkaliphilus hydrothermalis]MBM7615519.1 alkyl sulfatase BDS1-like metallo-beta-lactamase superfamily hydrolase [Alkaliphilus hydrothermalis]
MSNKKSKKDLNTLRKDATLKTRLINEEIYDNINWDKLKIDEELSKKNVVVKKELPIIRSNQSSLPVWDLERYDFLLKEKMPHTVNPKLWEQGKMNLNAGLFKVSDKIYQVRGFDLANLSLVRGETGWIVIDCLTSQETAEAAIDLANEYFKDIPISAVIFTHSHVDHYGGIIGVLNSNAEKGIKVYAPKGFTDAVIEENVNAGIAMSRRGIYMYGEVLPRDEKGQIDCGIGKYVSSGTTTFINSVHEISPIANQEYVEKEIDGVVMQFLLTEDTEAPSEMDIYIPSEKSLCIAENCSATLHNIYTLRGAEVRDPVAWAKDIQKAIDLWGDSLTSIFEVHTWPRFGNKYCIEYMEKQRDLYQYINDQTLRLINKGYTLEDIGRMVKLPESLSDEWYNSSFYGTVNHNSKAVYQKYMGWYNGNPVDLNKLPTEESAKKYIEYMGGEDVVLERAKKSFKDGEYQWVAEVTKQLIFANSENKNAKLLCADALEQLAYIAESGPWRNVYLTGAQELRHGIIKVKRSVITEDVLNAIPLENVLYLFSIRIDGFKAGDFDYKINFVIPDKKEVASAEVKRGIFRYLDNKLAEDAAVTVTMSKDTLYEIATTNNRPDSSKIIVEGDICKWQLFLWVQDIINLDFNIMTPVSNN